MTRFGWLVLCGIIVAVLGIALLLWGFARQSAPSLIDSGAPPAEVDPSSLSIYTNGVYGFSVLYPAQAVITDAFTDENEVPWRLSAGEEGAVVVRIELPVGEVRIGASEEAVETCEKKGASEEEGKSVTLGDTTWHVFHFDELGTDNERRVTSYRTRHDAQCFALETFAPLTPNGTAPSQELDFIVRNFTFAR